MTNTQNTSFVEKCKKNWKIILICLLGFCFLNKCTQSCNRQSTITKQEKQIKSLDSTIAVLVADTLAKHHTIDLLNERLNTANANTDAANARKEVADANAETAKANEATAKADAKAAKAKAEAEMLKKELEQSNDSSRNK